MTNRSASMTWMWLALFRLTLTLVMGYALTQALQQQLVSITRMFRMLP